MEDSIILNGKKYISSKRAAQIGGYTKDYVGQMCRLGKLDAKLIGRNWYILEKSLLSHKNNKKNSKNALDKANISYTKETPVYKVLVDNRPLNPDPIKSTIQTKRTSAISSNSFKGVQKSPPSRKFSTIRLAILTLLLIALLSTVFTEGSVVYDANAENSSAGIRMVNLDAVISDLKALISR